MSVLSDNTNRRITIQDAVAAKAEEKEKKETKKRERKPSAPKEKKPKAEKAVSEVSSNSASLHIMLVALKLKNSIYDMFQHFRSCNTSFLINMSDQQ